jgi:hypothetical protein
MTILETLLEANIAAKIKKLSFANLQEFNSYHDSFTFLDYPVNVLIPFNLTGRILNNRVKKVVTIEGFVFTRYNQDTNDTRSPEVERDFVGPMRELAEKFIKHLANSDMIDPEVEPIVYTIRREQMYLASHLVGVYYRVDLPVHGKICI